MKVSQPTSFGELEGLDYLVRNPDAWFEMPSEQSHSSAFIHRVWSRVEVVVLERAERRAGPPSPDPANGGSVTSMILNHSIPALLVKSSRVAEAFICLEHREGNPD